MLDSRWIPVFLVFGWLLITLGIWGAAELRWWIWPLSGGVACLLAGGAYGWAAVRQMRRQGLSEPPPAAKTMPIGAPLP